MTDQKARAYYKTKKITAFLVTGALALITAALTMALLTGCKADPQPIVSQAEQTSQPVAVADEPAQQPSAIATTAPDAAATDAVSPAATDDAAVPEEPEIIAESSNTVSDKEKQQILDDLTSELGKALDTLGDLDEPDDTDTDAGSIE